MSLVTITLRPSRFVSIATTLFTTAGSVSGPGITSVPTITCGGLNRCTPRKLRRNESLRPRAISAIDSPDDPVAMIASGRRLLSISSKNCFFEWQVFGERLEDDRRLADRAAEVGVVGAERDSLGDRLRARVVLRVRQPFRRFARRSRQHRDVVSGAGEDASRARTHRAVRADNYDLVVLGQVLSDPRGIAISQPQ